MLWKYLVLAAIIAAVWYGYKAIDRRNQASKVASAESEEGRIAAEDTVKCPSCGSYVVSGGAASCGRADCPW